MATVSSPSIEPLAVGAWDDEGRADSKSERYLARRLAAAGADYKGVALTTFLLATGVGFLTWVACGVLLEHWVVSGGLPRFARWAWFTTALVVLVAAAIRWLVPLLRYRVNLVYAARVIEQQHPELHNDLVNTVLVKAHPQGNVAAVVRTLERRAAKRLSVTSSEPVIDRAAAVRLAFALALLVGAGCVYAMVAPKSALTSTVRLLAPWVRTPPPTRVRVDAIRLHWRMPGEDDAVAEVPGDDDPRAVRIDGQVATVVRGRKLLVSAAIQGLGQAERPVVMVSPLTDAGVPDPAGVAWSVEMTRGPGDAAHSIAVLPDASRGLDKPLAFTLRAGDARTEPVRVTLVDAPTLLVREVRYEYPEYMKRERETVAWHGDLRAVEGTRVVVVTESNQPLEAAWIDFDCDGTRDLRLKIAASDLTRAVGSFVLQMNGDRTAGEHASYRLLFQPRGGTGADGGFAPGHSQRDPHALEGARDRRSRAAAIATGAAAGREATGKPAGWGG